MALTGQPPGIAGLSLASQNDTVLGGGRRWRMEFFSTSDSMAADVSVASLATRRRPLSDCTRPTAHPNVALDRCILHLDAQTPRAYTTGEGPHQVTCQSTSRTAKAPTITIPPPLPARANQDRVSQHRCRRLPCVATAPKDGRSVVDRLTGVPRPCRRCAHQRHRRVVARGPCTSPLREMQALVELGNELVHTSSNI